MGSKGKEQRCSRIRKFELLMGAVLAVALGFCLPYFISYYVYGDYSGKEAQAAGIIPVSGGVFATPTGQVNPFATEQAPFSAQFVQIATDIVFPTNTPKATGTFAPNTPTPNGTFTPTPRDRKDGPNPTATPVPSTRTPAPTASPAPTNTPKRQ